MAEEAGTLTFALVVNNGAEYSEPDDVDVVILDPAIGEKGGLCSSGGGGGGWFWGLSALASMSRRRRTR